MLVHASCKLSQEQLVVVVVVELLSRVQLSAAPRTAALQASLSFTISIFPVLPHLLEFAQTHVH